MKSGCLAVAGLPLLLWGCSRDIQNKEAIRQGVVDYLAGRSGLDINAMQVEVTSVAFRKDEADATVSFRPKGANAPGSGMQMNYTLEKKGNRWVVKGRRESGGTPHGGAPGGETALPPGHPQMNPKSSGPVK